MFAERFDALMRIAEVSNTLLGRAINMNSSHIGRFRNGARKLPKRHAFLTPACVYIAEHITKDYQFTALQKLTGIPGTALSSIENTAVYIEAWLLERSGNTDDLAERFISGFAQVAAQPAPRPSGITYEMPGKCVTYLYGNAGKRKAVEQLFQQIMQEKEPQTLLLFSEENMAWLYEDPAFAARWADLFVKVILRGNRVRIIHTVSRSMSELLEAVTKWVPIYLTGAIEPYYYPRLRDGVFQRTLFIAPNTAAIVSTSVQQDTGNMLNLFVTDHAALNALSAEYEHYFALCKPLIRIYTKQSCDAFQKSVHSLALAEADVRMICAAPPLFFMPEALVKKIASENGSETLYPAWKKSLMLFRGNIKKQRLTLTLLDPEIARDAAQDMSIPLAELFGVESFHYTRDQYSEHIHRLLMLEKRYDNLKVTFRSGVSANTLLYVKEDTAAVLAKTDSPMASFVISEINMINALWDYTHKNN